MSFGEKQEVRRACFSFGGNVLMMSMGRICIRKSTNIIADAINVDFCSYLFLQFSIGIFNFRAFAFFLGHHIFSLNIFGLLVSRAIEDPEWERFTKLGSAIPLLWYCSHCVSTLFSSKKCKGTKNSSHYLGFYYRRRAKCLFSFPLLRRILR